MQKMKLIDKKGKEHDVEFKQYGRTLRDILHFNNLISVEFTYSSYFGHQARLDIFYLGTPKYISNKLIIPINEIRNPRGETKQQVLEVCVREKKYSFIEPNYKKEGQKEAWQHSIANDQTTHDKWEHKAHHLRRSPPQYRIGRSSPYKIILCTEMIEEQLKEIGLSIKEIKPRK